jgi:trk system potassium uptake protein
MNHILIIGGGKLVYFLTRVFISKGTQVTIINKDKDECTRLARSLNATVVFGDGSDPLILDEAGAGNADALLAITPNDQDNLVVSQIATMRFAIPRTLALVNDPDNEEVFHKLGITAFSTTRIISNLIEQKSDFEEITNLIPVGEGDVTLTELILTESSPVIGKALKDIHLPEQSLIGYVIQNGKPIVPRGGTILGAGNRLIVISLPEQHGLVMKMLTGEK